MIGICTEYDFCYIMYVYQSIKIHMVIIIEGENKCGKTTLASYIVENYGFGYIKCSQPKKGGPYKEYRGIIDRISKEPGNYVIDRFHLGEFVYGPIYRGSCGLSQGDFEDIEKRLIELGTILIYCYDVENNIAKRFKEENEEFADVKKIKKLKDIKQNTKYYFFHYLIVVKYLTYSRLALDPKFLKKNGTANRKRIPYKSLIIIRSYFVVIKITPLDPCDP